MFNEDASPKEGLEFFFGQIWQEQDGFVYLPTRDPKTEEWKSLMYKWPQHKSYVVNHVLSATAKGLDVFFAPALFSESNPKKEFVKGSNVVWTDFDGNAPEEWPEPDPQEGQERPASGPPAVPVPSMRVQSSTDTHEHVYWVLDSFETDVSRIESINRSISYTYRADTSGWDANQILRPPYTTNYKHDLPVTLASYRKGGYSKDKFGELKPILELVSDAIDTENLPLVELVVAKYAWDEEHFKMFMDPQIEEGHRSSALMRLGYFGAEVGMTDAEIYAILENADSRWGKFKKRSDRKKRLLDIVNRAKTKHSVPTNSLTFQGLLKNENEVEINRRYIYGFQDFLEEDIEVEWLVDSLLEIGGFGMFAAAPGVGKTQLALQIACSTALGLEFIGYEIPCRRRVTFFSLEMGPVALRMLLDTITHQYTIDQRQVLQENLQIVPLGESLPVSRDESLKFVKTVLDETQPGLVLFDSLAKLSGGKFDAEGSAKINDFYAAVRNRYDSSIIIVHHNRKANGDNKRPTSLADVYGEVYIASDMTFVMTLWHDDDWPKNQVEAAVVKMRLAAEPDPVMLHRNEFLNFGVTSNVTGLGFTKSTVFEHPEDEDASSG